MVSEGAGTPSGFPFYCKILTMERLRGAKPLRVSLLLRSIDNGAFKRGTFSSLPIPSILHNSNRKRHNTPPFIKNL